jgi:hypothetical protein
MTGRWTLPPLKPHTCQRCGGWPATIVVGPTATDRLCETCAKEDD